MTPLEELAKDIASNLSFYLTGIGATIRQSDKFIEISTPKILQALKQTIEKAAKVAEEHNPSEKATESLRCNPKDAKKPYIDSSTMNGYDWACDDIAQSIRNILEEK